MGRGTPVPGRAVRYEPRLDIPIASLPSWKRQHSGVRPMTWETPDFVEIRMDAEINYMDDFARDEADDVED